MANNWGIAILWKRERERLWGRHISLIHGNGISNVVITGNIKAFSFPSIHLVQQQINRWKRKVTKKFPPGICIMQESNSVISNKFNCVLQTELHTLNPVGSCFRLDKVASLIFSNFLIFSSYRNETLVYSMFSLVFFLSQSNYIFKKLSGNLENSYSLKYYWNT